MSQPSSSVVHTSRGRRALVVAVLEVMLTIAGVVTFNHGQRPLVALPGRIDMAHLPDTPEVRAAVKWLWAAAGLLGLALISAVTAFVLGWRCRDEDDFGSWAWVTGACWPLLAVLMIGGISAT